RHRALSVPPRHGAGPRQRFSAAILLSPKPGLGSRCHGATRGSEAPDAHTSWPIARSGDTQPMEGSGRSVDASGLPQSGRGGRVHRKHDCGDRTREPAASGEVKRWVLVNLFWPERNFRVGSATPKLTLSTTS